MTKAEIKNLWEEARRRHNGRIPNFKKGYVVPIRKNKWNVQWSKVHGLLFA